MKLLVCTALAIHKPSAGLNRLERMRSALRPNGIEVIIVGTGDCPYAPWQVDMSDYGSYIVFDPARIRVWRHCESATLTAQTALFYRRHLMEIISAQRCAGVICYTFQADNAGAILAATRQAGGFVFADMVEWFNISWHYMFNGVNIQQARMRRYVLPNVDGMIGISKGWCEWADQRDIANIWIPSFAEDSGLFRTTPPPPNRPLTLAFIGHLVSRELPQVIMRAIQLCYDRDVDVRMNVLGNVRRMPSECTAMRIIRKNPVLAERVKFLGFVSDTERDILLADADAFILLRSNTRETDMLFPTRLPEYLLSANAVILSRVGSFRECFEHRKDVWFIDGRNAPEEVAEALIYLAEHPQDRLEIGRRGRETAIRLFAPALLGSRLAGFLDGIVQRKSGGC